MSSKKNDWINVIHITNTLDSSGEFLSLSQSSKAYFRCHSVVTEFFFIPEGDILVSQALTFFIAGFETTSSTMGFALYEFAHNQDIQEKLRNEINVISEKYGGIKYDSIKDMPYLDMCIKGAFLEKKKLFIFCFVF